MSLPDHEQIETNYTGRHSINVMRVATSYVRITITSDRSKAGKYVDITPRDAAETGFKMILTALRAAIARR